MGDGSLQSHSGVNLNPKTAKDRGNVPKGGEAGRVALTGIPLELLPLREVNHEINLVDPTKCIRYRLPKCPEHFREDLSTKIERYTTAEWWVPAVAHQAVPMLRVPRKNGTLRTVFDL
jgi:hypothetical protein